MKKILFIFLSIFLIQSSLVKFVEAENKKEEISYVQKVKNLMKADKGISKDKKIAYNWFIEYSAKINPAVLDSIKRALLSPDNANAMRILERIAFWKAFRLAAKSGRYPSETEQTYTKTLAELTKNEKAMIEFYKKWVDNKLASVEETKKMTNVQKAEIGEPFQDVFFAALS